MGTAAGILTLTTVLDIGARQPTPEQGIRLLIAALALTIAFPRAPAMVAPLRLPSTAAGRRLYLGILIAVLGCIVAGSGAYGGYQSFDNLFYTGLLAYGAGAVLVVAGLCLASDYHPRWRPKDWLALFLRHRAEVLAVTFVVLLGIVLRLYQLGYYPPPYGFFIIDEPQIGGAASDFIHHNSHPWSYPELVYGAVLAFKIFGASMLALRYPVVLAGIIMFCAFYPCARLFYSWPVALAGTTLLAVSRYDIAYMRQVLPACTMMVFEFLIFLLGALAIRGRGTYFNYAAMGLLTGMGLYSHTSFRLVPLLLILWWFGWLVIERRYIRAIVRAHSLGWLLFLAVAAITALPYVHLVRLDPHSAFTERLTSIMPLLFNRTSASAADPGATLLTNAEQLAGYFVGPADANLTVNPPNTSLLDPVTGTLFLLGLGYGLLHLRRPYILFLVAWFALTLIAGGLLTLTVDGHRFIGALPSIFLLACLPLEVAWRTIRSWRPPAAQLATAVVLIGLADAGWVNFDTTFNRLSHSIEARTLFDDQDLEAIRYFAQHGAHSYNYLMGYFAFPAAGTDYGWMVQGLQGRNAVDLHALLPMHDPPAGATVHILVAEPYPPVEVAQAIARIYPAARTVYWHNIDQSQLFSATTVTTAAIAAQQGLAGPCPVPASCQGVRPVARRGAIHWTGSIYIPIRGAYLFSAKSTLGRSRLSVVVRLDGQPVPGAIHLYPGWYNVDVETRDAAPVGTPTLTWKGPNGTGTVPAYDLRKTPAHGMLLQFPGVITPAQGQGAPRRVPFPFFQAIVGADHGWPATGASKQTYRALLSGIVCGHAGEYAMQLRSFRGRTAVFLDDRLVARGVGTPDEGPTLTQISLRLSGHPQMLRIEFETQSDPDNAVGAALFVTGVNGAPHGFLPWEWLSPPPLGGFVPKWLPFSSVAVPAHAGASRISG